MAQVNHKCVICGKDYLACDDCSKTNSWRVICDIPEHYQVYMALVDVRANRTTKSNAKKQLEYIGVSDYESFKPSVRDIVCDILASGTVDAVSETNSTNETDTPDITATTDSLDTTEAANLDITNTEDIVPKTSASDNSVIPNTPRRGRKKKIIKPAEEATESSI